MAGISVVGPAGAGKTTAIKDGIVRLRADRRPVLGLTPSGKAADVLATTAGCPATTPAKLLHDVDTGRPLPPRGTTVVLDEAGMARTEDLDRLVRLVQRHWWRLVCVGDPEQLPAVGRGGMFAHWCDTLPTHELRQLHRFDHQWEADASLALRRGGPEAARTYAEHGRVHALHPALVARAAATSYLDAAARGDTVAITTATAATAQAINVEIQRCLHPAGPSVELADGTVAGLGDHVATRRNDRRLGVRNRHTWDVTAIGPDGQVTVADPERGSVVLPAVYVAEHLELGWPSPATAHRESRSTRGSASWSRPAPGRASTSASPPASDCTRHEASTCPRSTSDAPVPGRAVSVGEQWRSPPLCPTVPQCQQEPGVTDGYWRTRADTKSLPVSAARTTFSLARGVGQTRAGFAPEADALSAELRGRGLLNASKRTSGPASSGGP